MGSEIKKFIENFTLEKLKIFNIKILLFLILFAPMVLQRVKAMILAIIILAVFIEIISKRKIIINRKILMWSIIYCLTNLFFLLRGTHDNTEILKMLFPVNVLWPIVYTIVLIAASSQIKTLDISKFFVMTTLSISCYILYIILNFSGFLPNSFILNLPLIYSINNDFGFLNFFTPSITSLFFLIPYNISLAMNPNPTAKVKKIYLYLAILLSTIASILVGRRALIGLIFVTPFISLFWSNFAFDLPITKILGEKALFLKKINFKKIMIGIVMTVVIIIISFVLLLNLGLRIGNLDNDLIEAATDVRYEQFYALINGWLENPFLGVGFGINAEGSIRSEVVPGLYELTYIAKLFHTGLIGIIIYLFLFLWAVKEAVKILKVDKQHIYYFIPTLTGTSAVLIGQSSNPYMNSFDGLWVIFYPLAIINLILLNQVDEKKKMMKHVNVDNNEKIAILMATYNGENYISEQVESIISQTYTNWELIIRDDGSTDNTLEILSRYQKIDKRIRIIKDDVGNLGQCLNFNELMKHVKKHSYIMFSDQDDVWEKNKIEASINAIKGLENTCKKNTPVLVYTNYDVSDSQLNYRKRVYKQNHYEIKHAIASRLLVQNWIMGCTMIINNKLLKDSIDIPIEAENHDNWIALIASLTGEIGYLDDVTMIHRVHSTNVTTRSDTSKFSNRINRVMKRFQDNEASFDKREVLSHLLKKQIGLTDHDQNKMLNQYQHLLEIRGIHSVFYAFKNKFYAVNKLQTTLFYVQLFKRAK